MSATAFMMVSSPCPTCGRDGVPDMSMPQDAPSRLLNGWWVTPLTYYWYHLSESVKDCGPFFTEYREQATGAEAST